MTSQLGLLPAFLVMISLATAACGNASTQLADGIDVTLVATSELGEPLAGVPWSLSGRVLGQTGAGGELSQRLAGPEGRVVTLSATCPAGYQESPAVVQARLKSAYDLSGKAEPTKYDAVCARVQVDVVLVVHTSGVAGIPVRVDGRAVAVTDEHGTAHIYLPSPRATKRVDVTLETSGLPTLSPASPSRSFELHSRDAILVFEQAFSSSRPRSFRSRPRRTRIPDRID